MADSVLLQFVILYVIVECLSNISHPDYLSFKECIHHQIQSNLELIYYNFSPRMTFVLTINSTAVTFWIFGGIFLYFDCVDNKLTKFIKKFKVQKGKNSPPNKAILLNTIYNIIQNQIIVFLLSLFIGFDLVYHRNNEFLNLNNIPSIRTISLSIIFNSIIYEILFYTLHYLCHRINYLYSNIHKIHHEYTSPIGISAEYAHWIEQIVVNTIPLFVGFYMLGSHIVTIFIFANLGILWTLIDHSGYHLPFLKSPEFHDYHHYATTSNYGAIGWMDSLFGTDYKFKKSYKYQLHSTFYSMNNYLKTKTKWIGKADKFGKLN